MHLFTPLYVFFLSLLPASPDEGRVTMKSSIETALRNGAYSIRSGLFLLLQIGATFRARLLSVRAVYREVAATRPAASHAFSCVVYDWATKERNHESN